MLQQLGWPTLQHQCLEARATMIYKIINNLVHIDQRYLSYNLRNTRSHSLHLYHLRTYVQELMPTAIHSPLRRLEYGPISSITHLSKKVAK